VNWQEHARALADQVTDPASRWHTPLSTVPRHLLVPRWWQHRTLHDGPADERAWMAAAYGDETLVTQLGTLHADHADPADHPTGRLTSSSTLPSLVIRMYQHAHLYPGADILDVATGSGYGCALLTSRFGAEHVTSIDIDPYLTKAATARLDEAGLHPRVLTRDATGPLPGSYDRIVSMVAVRPIPATWLHALRPGGRLVTVLAATTLILTATKDDDGWATGRIEWDRAGFMPTRTGPDYPPPLHEAFTTARHGDGDQVTTGRYPVLNLNECWELQSMLEVTTPGIEHYYHQTGDGTRTALMLHPDGSWARATAHDTGPPAVHQSGPQRLWDALDTVRDHWRDHGQFPLYGATVFIPPDGGKIHLARGDWTATLT
jgi:protein-L-isoaspartate O-methyltransferase